MAQLTLAQCEVRSLTVTCSHSQRKMLLDLVCGKPTRDDKDYVLQVVSKPDEPERSR